MVKSKDKQKINPVWSARKSKNGKPCFEDETRHHWRKIFFIRGKRIGKRNPKPKSKEINRTSIREITYV